MINYDRIKFYIAGPCFQCCNFLANFDAVTNKLERLSLTRMFRLLVQLQARTETISTVEHFSGALTLKYQTRLKIHADDKRPSLFVWSISYGKNGFITSVHVDIIRLAIKTRVASRQALVVAVLVLTMAAVTLRPTATCP